MFSWRQVFGIGILAFASCSITNAPVNKLLTSDNDTAQYDSNAQYTGDDELYIGLAFSGGGTRASAFSYGVLKALQAATQDDKNPDGLLPNVRLVSGVSGGSVTAAYFGLRGAKGLATYREDFLIQNAEKYMANSILNPLTLVRGLTGGANGRKTFARFLDESLFHKATFADLAKNGHATTWLNASDVANNTPFLFSPETFDALCSDLASLPISEAVSASAAFPLVFSPIVLKAHGTACDYTEPDWLTAARFNPEATSAMRAYGETLESYRDPEKVKYLKLLDGGITDNFGTTSLSVARAKAQNEYGPLSAKDAVKLKRMLFLVSNAGVQTDFKWTQKIRGPGGMQLAMSIANSAMGSATRVGYDVLRLSLDRWVDDLVTFRCSLSRNKVKQLRGTLQGWDCKDLKMFIGEISFAALDKGTRKQLNQIPTRLRLKTDEVDLVIQAGINAANSNPELNGFLRSLDGYKPAKPTSRIKPRRISPSN